MKILNFGSCNLDYVYTLDHIVAPGETESSDAYAVFPGGKGLNQSVACARAGAEIWHAGCIGQNGDLLRDVLAESGANVSCLKAVESPNGHAVIQVSRKGENSIFLYPGSNEKITEEQIDGVLSRFAEGDFLLLQNEVNLVPRMVERAHARGLKIVLNPSPFNEKIGEIDFSLLTYLILNEVEGKALSGSDSPEECLAYLRKKYPALTVVLTLGTQGCILSSPRETLSHPAYAVTAVDTTAAGDTFTGYFFASVAAGEKEEEALRLASAASALAVSRMGAASSIPYLWEVREALTSLKPIAAGPNAEETQRNRIAEYISAHLRDATLEGAAQWLGYSSAYTGSLIKKRFGIPFSKLLQRSRAAAAAHDLATTDDSVTEIIDRVGYKNESFFRKAFRERYAVTPGEYRNMKRGEKK